MKKAYGTSETTLVKQYPHHGMPEGEEKEKGTVFKAIMVENFPITKRETNIQSREDQRKPSQSNLKGRY